MNRKINKKLNFCENNDFYLHSLIYIRSIRHSRVPTVQPDYQLPT